MQRILLLVTADNGLTQRIRLALRRTGRHVDTAVVATAADMETAAATLTPDLILCPYLKTGVPVSLYRSDTPVVVIHPGPVGDRGPASLDWAITDREPIWGAIAFSATDDFDSGPLWGHRTFPLPHSRKTAIYNTAFSDAATELAIEVADNAADPTFVPTPQDHVLRAIEHARARPGMKIADRRIDWRYSGESIVTTVHAADGSPGAVADLAGHQFRIFDAHLGRAQVHAEPGTIIGRHHHGIEVAAGNGTSVWVGHLRAAGGCKAPAAAVLARAGVPIGALPVADGASWTDVRYTRTGPVGTVSFTAYNGAMTTDLCRRLVRALRHAMTQDTQVVVLTGQGPYFSNGLHLGAIENASHPDLAAWDNLIAMNEVSKVLLTCTSHTTIAAINGNAGAGGVMMALAADVVVAAERVVLSPHYALMGLTGSELHTFTLPRRVGASQAAALLAECEPVDAVSAQTMGMVDQLGPNDTFSQWVTDYATALSDPRSRAITAAVHADRDLALAATPLTDVEQAELTQMAADIFHSGQFHRRRGEFMKTSAPSSAVTAPPKPIGHVDPVTV